MGLERADVVAVYERYLACCNEHRLQELVIEDDMLAARLIGQGTHSGTFGGIAPTGRRISTQELVIYRLADGKIAQVWGDLFPVVRDALTAPPTT